MRYYEIVILIHPDQSAQVPVMVDRYQAMIKESGGVVSRHEDWGRRQLAYSINKVAKAHYILLNIECGEKILGELETAFRYNDAVLRYLITRCSGPISEPSPMMTVAKQTHRRQPAGDEEGRSSKEDLMGGEDLPTGAETE